MSEKLKIFLAEDNAADAFLIGEALSRANLTYSLHRASDGEMALNTLQELEKDRSPLSLILLDLNLPKISGHDLLAHIRSSEQLRATPVIVMTSSDSPADRTQAASLQISHYFRKPTNFNEFLRLGSIVKSICQPEEF